MFLYELLLALVVYWALQGPLGPYAAIPAVPPDRRVAQPRNPTRPAGLVGMSKGGKKATAKCRFLLNTNLPVTAFIAWATGRRGHPSLGWLRKHGRESCYTRITLQELKALEARGVLCPGDAARAIKLLEQYGVKYRKMRSTHLRRARQLALQGAIGRGQANDATLLLYAKTNRLILVSYNYRDLDELAQLLAWSYKVPPGEPLGPQNYPQLHLCRRNKRDEERGEHGSPKSSRRSREARSAQARGRGSSRQGHAIRANPPGSPGKAKGASKGKRKGKVAGRKQGRRRPRRGRGDEA